MADSDDIVNVLAEGIMGQEVIGEGTTDLRSFNTLDILATTNLDKLIGFNRSIALTLGYWSESTNRTVQSLMKT